MKNFKLRAMCKSTHINACIIKKVMVLNENGHSLQAIGSWPVLFLKDLISKARLLIRHLLPTRSFTYQIFCGIYVFSWREHQFFEKSYLKILWVFLSLFKSWNTQAVFTFLYIQVFSKTHREGWVQVYVIYFS